MEPSQHVIPKLDPALYIFRFRSAFNHSQRPSAASGDHRRPLAASSNTQWPSAASGNTRPPSAASGNTRPPPAITRQPLAASANTRPPPFCSGAHARRRFAPTRMRTRTKWRQPPPTVHKQPTAVRPLRGRCGWLKKTPHPTRPCQILWFGDEQLNGAGVGLPAKCSCHRQTLELDFHFHRQMAASWAVICR